MSDKIDMIYDTMTTYHGEARERMSRMEEDLREHKEGVIQNRSRIETLEKPGIALRTIRQWAIWLVTVGGGVAMLAKIKEFL